MTATERQRIEKIKQAGGSWTARENFWLFGTCTYVDGSLVSMDRCIKNMRKYFNELDRRMLIRKQLENGTRLERLVYTETGRWRINRHIHFYIKGYELFQYKIIWQQCEWLWTKLIDNARVCIVKDNLARDWELGNYCWKEFDELGTEVLLTDCCHLKTT